MSELSLSHVFNPAAGWYRGDFHAHTDRSDGRYPAVEVARMAREQGLDFFAITDHNTLNSFDQFGDDPGLLVIAGLEVTLDVGHWNVFGLQGTPISAWQGWMKGICGDRISVSLAGGRTTSSVLAEIATQGLVSSINHPFLKPWEWRDDQTGLDYVNFMEVWNDHLWPDNRQATPAAIAYWTRLLNAGVRLTAIGGSDFHFLPGEHRSWPGEYLGKPTTWVYAEQLSGAAVLEGLRRGRAYVSVGPRLAFEACCAGETAGIGDSLEAWEGEIELVAQTEGIEGEGSLRLIQDGEVIDFIPVRQGMVRHQKGLRIASGEAHWFRIEVIDGEGDLLAFTNPIFTGKKRQTQAKRFGEFL